MEHFYVLQFDIYSEHLFRTNTESFFLHKEKTSNLVVKRNPRRDQNIYKYLKIYHLKQLVLFVRFKIFRKRMSLGSYFQCKIGDLFYDFFQVRRQPCLIYIKLYLNDRK